MSFSSRFTRALAGMALFLAGAGFAVGGPIGYLQVDGRIDVKPEGAERAVRVSENNYTVFSGDLLLTGGSSAVLVLNSGGVIGLGNATVARVVFDEDSSELAVRLDEGIVLYAIPQFAISLNIELDEFRLQAGRVAEGRLQVRREVGDSANDSSGMVERLDGGHIRVSVRNGDMQVFGAGDSRYLVSAGEQVGLLANTGSINKTAFVASMSLVRLVEIEAPERVRTREDFWVRWNAIELPPESYITIAPSGSDPEEFDSVASTTQGSILEFQAPDSPGDYEIRFVDADTGQLIDFVYLQVIGDPILVPWYTTRLAIAGISFAGGLTTAWLTCSCGDDDETPVSP